MKITNIKTDVFAGLTDVDLSFQDGLNVVYGDNEAGKSSVINLVDQLLYKNSKIMGRGVDEVAFKNNYFPSELKSGSAAKAANGSMEFTDGSGKYKLEKTWAEKGNSVKFVSPAGLFADDNDVADEIKKCLVHSKSIVEDILLTPQKNAYDMLAHLLSADSDTSLDIAKKMTLMHSAAGSTALDGFADGVKAKIEEMNGNWDESTDTIRLTSAKALPKKGNGTVAQAYIRFAELKENFSKAEAREKAYNEASAKASEALNLKNEADAKKDSFTKHYSDLKSADSNRKMLAETQGKLEELKQAKEDFPKYKEQAEKAEKLLIALESIKASEEYNSLKGLNGEIEEINNRLSGMTTASEDDVRELRKLEKDINTFASALKGPEIEISLKMFGDNKVEVVSVATGKPIPVTGDKLTVSEAVRLTVPGVMEMGINSVGCDVEEITSKLKQAEDDKIKLCEKYKVSSADELSEKISQATQCRSELDSATNKKTTLLAGRNEADIKDAVCSMTTDEVNDVSDKLLGASLRGEEQKTKLVSLKAAAESNVSAISSKYTDEANISLMIAQKAEEEKKYQAEIDKLGSIPAEFAAAASDPDSFMAELDNACKLLGEQYSTAKENAVRAEENYINEDKKDDVKDALEKQQAVFNELDEELKRWRMIEKVYTDLKSSIATNSMQNLADNFLTNLSMLTDSTLESEIPAGDELAITLYSGSKHKLDLDKLSEGTKDAVALAFRLAVFDELYSDGWFCIFDDSLINMDSKREAKAVELIQDFAKNHQVIYFTCKEDMKNKLGGNIIEL